MRHSYSSFRMQCPKNLSFPSFNVAITVLLVFALFNTVLLWHLQLDLCMISLKSVSGTTFLLLLDFYGALVLWTKFLMRIVRPARCNFLTFSTSLL